MTRTTNITKILSKKLEKGAKFLNFLNLLTNGKRPYSNFKIFPLKIYGKQLSKLFAWIDGFN